MSELPHPLSPHRRIALTVWATFTRSPGGIPISREACAILLAFVTARPPRYILRMRLDDVEFSRAIWRVPEWDGKRSYQLPMPRLALALVRQAHSFRKPRDGGFLFPGCFDRQAPMDHAVITRTFRRAGIAPSVILKRPAYDIPAAAAWIMVEAGVRSEDVEAVMHRTNQHEMLRKEKFMRSEDWIFQRSKIALEAFEIAFMSIVGLSYSDQLFELPRFPHHW